MNKDEENNTIMCYDNEQSFSCIQENIRKKFQSVLEKSIEISLTYADDTALLKALAIAVGSSVTILAFTRLTVPTTKGDTTLFSKLNLNNILVTRYNPGDTVSYEQPVISLEFAYHFLDRVDKALDKTDDLLKIQDEIILVFKQNNWKTK